MALPAPQATDGLDVLVTGGAGFIGSHVVDRLLAAGHRPRIFDLRRSAYHDSCVPAVRGDVGDLAGVCRAVRGCDAVIHLAAAADVARVEAAPAEAEEHNGRGTLHVLEAARRAGIERVVYASTIWVYSDTEHELLEESVPLRPPAHLYTATKLAGELYCHAYHELYGLDYTILRFGIPYGPRARPGAVIPTFVACALAHQPLTVAGDGSQSRRFVYVEDLADGVVRALAPVAANRVYNLVGSRDVTVTEVAETVRELVGDVGVVGAPGRSGDFAGAPVSGARAERELGWTPCTPFPEGVRRYLEWHRTEHTRPVPPATAWRPALATLLRRGALATLMAAVVSVAVLGLALLVPIDADMNRFDTFAAMLVLLLPLVLATGFEWEAERARVLRAACWTWVAAALAPIVVPWPPLLDRLGHAHPVFLSLLALSGGVAALAIGSAWLDTLLPAAGE
jgi:UDP-glucose 4-epimerase